MISAPGTPRFSVVIVTFGRPGPLRRVLEALEKQEQAPTYEVVVIDNDPRASARGVVEAFFVRHSTWRYEVSPRNNVSLARNVGAGLASGDWLAFLDDDCVPLSPWLARAEQIVAVHPAAGLVFGGGYIDSRSSAPAQSQELKRELPPQEYLVEGNLFFHRSEYLALGGMRTDLGPTDGRFGYHEGSELQDRHREKFTYAHRRVLDPQLAVVHLEANPLGKTFLALLAGFDAVRAFSQGRPRIRRWLYEPFKLPGPIVRMVFHALTARPSNKRVRVLREIYRTGEILGEIRRGNSEVGRALAMLLRRINNRRTFWGGSSDSPDGDDHVDPRSLHSRPGQHRLDGRKNRHDRASGAGVFRPVSAAILAGDGQLAKGHAASQH